MLQICDRMLLILRCVNQWTEFFKLQKILQYDLLLLHSFFSAYWLFWIFSNYSTYLLNCDTPYAAEPLESFDAISGVTKCVWTIVWGKRHIWQKTIQSNIFFQYPYLFPSMFLLLSNIGNIDLPFPAMIVVLAQPWKKFVNILRFYLTLPPCMK